MTIDAKDFMFLEGTYSIIKNNHIFKRIQDTNMLFSCNLPADRLYFLETELYREDSYHTVMIRFVNFIKRS